MKKLNAKKNTNKPEIPGKVKKGYRIYVMAVLALTLTMSMLLPRSDDFGSRWEDVTEQGKIAEPDLNPVF